MSVAEWSKDDVEAISHPEFACNDCILPCTLVIVSDDNNNNSGDRESPLTVGFSGENYFPRRPRNSYRNHEILGGERFRLAIHGSDKGYVRSGDIHAY